MSAVSTLGEGPRGSSRPLTASARLARGEIAMVLGVSKQAARERYGERALGPLEVGQEDAELGWCDSSRRSVS